MATELIKQLLETGVHFGHQTKRWNPKMEKFIFGQRNGIYIIDLEKTLQCLEEARSFLKEVASGGGSILFVGTKKQAQETIQEQAQRAGVFYISQRWVGGLLTNFETVRKSVEHLKDLEKMRDEGIMDKFSKKEISRLTKEMNKLKRNFSGIMDMEKLPKVLFVIDPKKEETAVREAKRLGVSVVALIDTNADPDFVDFPIPGNDDAIRSIKLITTLIAESIAEGREEFLHIKKEKKVAELTSKPVEPSTAVEPSTKESVEEDKDFESLVDEQELEKLEKTDEQESENTAGEKTTKKREKGQ